MNDNERVLVDKKAVLQEEKRLTRIFSELDANLLENFHALIQNCAFITVSIRELQKHISKNGFTEVYKNGKEQSGVKKSIHAQLHHDYSKVLETSLKTLAGYVPPAKRKNTLLEALKNE